MEGIRKHHVSTPKKIIDSVKDHQSLIDAKVTHWRLVGKGISKVPRVSHRNNLLIGKETKKQKQWCSLDQFIKVAESIVRHLKTWALQCDAISRAQPFLVAALVSESCLDPMPWTGLHKCLESQCLQGQAPSFSFFFFFLFFIFRATPGACGSSQARSLIRAIAAGLHHSHSNAKSKPRLQPTPQLTAT